MSADPRAAWGRMGATGSRFDPRPGGDVERRRRAARAPALHPWPAARPLCRGQRVAPAPAPRLRGPRRVRLPRALQRPGHQHQLPEPRGRGGRRRRARQRGARDGARGGPLRGKGRGGEGRGALPRLLRPARDGLPRAPCSAWRAHGRRLRSDAPPRPTPSRARAASWARRSRRCCCPSAACGGAWTSSRRKRAGACAPGSTASP